MSFERSALSDRLETTIRTGRTSESPMVNYFYFCRVLRLREAKEHMQSHTAIQWDEWAEPESLTFRAKLGDLCEERFLYYYLILLPFNDLIYMFVLLERHIHKPSLIFLYSYFLWICCPLYFSNSLVLINLWFPLKIKILSFLLTYILKPVLADFQMK